MYRASVQEAPVERGALEGDLRKDERGPDAGEQRDTRLVTCHRRR